MVLLALFFWNTQNTLSANNTVDREMEFLDKHYYRMKEFTEKEPGSRIFLTFTPFNEGKFYLGADAALDLLLGENITKFPARATHIYDDTNFIKVAGRPGPRERGLLGDFTVFWNTFRYDKIPERPEAGVLGYDGYPRISDHEDGYVKVELERVPGGEVESYRLDYPPGTTIPVRVVKQGGWLCLFSGSDYAVRLRLGGEHLDWEGDGPALLGGFYHGEGGPVYISNLTTMLGRTDVKCAP